MDRATLVVGETLRPAHRPRTAAVTGHFSVHEAPLTYAAFH